MLDSRKWIMIITGALVGLGLVMVFSTGAAHSDRFGSSTLLLFRQAVWLALGLLAMLAAYRIDYRLYEKHWKVILIATCVALALVLIPGIGTKLNGARRWLRAFGWGIQPSEFAKIGLAIFVAAYLSTRREQMNGFVKGFLPVAGAVGAVFLLVALEPDAGTALLLGTVACLMLFVGGVRTKHLLPVAGVAALVFGLLVCTHLDYVRGRWDAFMHPDSNPTGANFQPRQSLVALGSGGLLGKGLGCGEIKLVGFLPEPYTDFILSIIGEELGLVGVLTVLGLFVALVYHGMKVAMTAPDRFGFLLVFGLILFIGLQAAINVAVVTASVPTKGISLPLISYGGSSLLASLFSLGIVLNVTRAGETVESRDGELAEMTADPGEPSPNPLAS